MNKQAVRVYWSMIAVRAFGGVNDTIQSAHLPIRQIDVFSVWMHNRLTSDPDIHILVQQAVPSYRLRCRCAWRLEIGFRNT